MAGSILTHSSPSSRFRPDKIADFLSLLNHVCALLKEDTAIGLYLLSAPKNRNSLAHIQVILEVFKVGKLEFCNVSHYTVVTHC
jgi:hypothetical protein